MKHFAVHVDFIAGGEVTSTGIAFDDYARMSTQVRKLNAYRRGPAPAWAFNDSKLRAVIVNCIEARSVNSIQKIDRTGTDVQRLARAQARLAGKRANLEARIDRLCRQYVAAKNSGEQAAKELAQKVEEVDTQLRLIDNPAKYYAGVAYHYWRSGLNSVETGQQLGIKPPHVRALLWRMGKAAGQLGYDKLKTIQHRPGTKAANQHAAREARKPAREAVALANRRKCQEQADRRLKYEAAWQAAMLTLKHRKDDKAVFLAAKKLVELSRYYRLSK